MVERRDARRPGMLGGGQRTARSDVVAAHLPFHATGFLLPAAGDNPLFQNLVPAPNATRADPTANRGIIRVPDVFGERSLLAVTAATLRHLNPRAGAPPGGRARPRRQSAGSRCGPRGCWSRSRSASNPVRGRSAWTGSRQPGTPISQRRPVSLSYCFARPGRQGRLYCFPPVMYDTLTSEAPSQFRGGNPCKSSTR